MRPLRCSSQSFSAVSLAFNLASCFGAAARHVRDVSSRGLNELAYDRAFVARFSSIHSKPRREFLVNRHDHRDMHLCTPSLFWKDGKEVLNKRDLTGNFWQNAAQASSTWIRQRHAQAQLPFLHPLSQSLESRSRISHVRRHAGTRSAYDRPAACPRN